MTKPSSRAGFTLVELMFTSVIVALLIAGVLSAFIFQRRTLQVQQQMNELQQNVRTAMSMVSRDIYNAGYGVRLSNNQLPL